MDYSAPYGKERLSGRGYFTPTGATQGVDLGNVDMFKIDFGIKRKEHFGSRRGIQTLDRFDAYSSQPLWTITCDEFVSPTLAYAWAGTPNANFAQTAQVAQSIVFAAGATTGSKKGATFDLGKYGLYDASIAAKVEGYSADYVIDRAGGKVYIPLTSSIVDAATFTVIASWPALTYDSVVALNVLNRNGSLEVHGEDDSGQGKSTTGSPGLDALPPVRYLFTIPCILSADESGEWKVDDYRKITIKATATAPMTVKRLQ
jgi:hypothetical protein